MPTVTHCPSCNRQLRVPDNLFGQKVKCPSCGGIFTADVDAGELPAAPLVEDEAPRPASRQPAIPPPDAGYEEEPPQPRHRPADHTEEDDEEEPPQEGDDDRPRPRRRRRRRLELQPHRGTLILILGILSIVLTCLGFILGPTAWIMGNNDLREIRAGRMDPEGEGTTNAGRICGIIGTILFALWLPCCCIGSWPHWRMPVGGRGF